jgi:putative glutamine amidotransferase
MSKRPILGIMCCTRQVGTENAQAVINRYIFGALKYADVNALLIPALPDFLDATDIAERLDGLLLTGSPSNMAPEHYGDTDGDGPYDTGRDEMVLKMIEAITAKMRPVFGICRGFQELNVALGGTLRRDVGSEGRNLSHHAPADVSFAEMFEHKHPVHLTDGGILRNTFEADYICVNSVHYQGVATVAPNVTIEATAPDGLIEAFSTHINKAPILAVQWHPEWATENNPHSQDYFKLLGRALRGDTLKGNNNGNAA